jgi:hypothetical protein
MIICGNLGSVQGQSEEGRRLVWQVLQEIRQVLEILGDQRIPYEGEMKRFGQRAIFCSGRWPIGFTEPIKGSFAGARADRV